MFRLLARLLVLAPFVYHGGAAIAGDTKKPLAELPSKPGPHIDKIKALGDNQWLSLGMPAADPKWGKARGRSWSSNMPCASDLRGMFVFAEGVHGFVKPDGHYMNDIFFYDINANRWICVYPGIAVKSLVQRIKDKELTVDDTGLLVEKDGQPLPPLLIHGYGYLGYDPDQKKFVFFGGQFENYFTTGERGVFREANQLYREQRKEKTPRAHAPFYYDAVAGKFGAYAVDRVPGRQGYGANVLAYVGSKKQLWFGGSDGAWYLDSAKSKWIAAEPKGSPPNGIDHCAAYDSKRDRIYYHQHDGKSAENNFLIYDVKQNTWSKPAAKGAAPPAATSYESIYNYDSANDALVIIRLYGKNQRPGPGSGIYVYHPETNTWDEPLPLSSDVFKSIRNGNYGCYDPELNAYFCHFASDSDDNGTMWAYRYKNVVK